MANDIVVVEFNQAYENGKMVDYVLYGERSSIHAQVTSARVDELNPEKLRSRGSENQRDLKRAFFEHRWEQIRPSYEAWKDGHEIPETGTPIDVMPNLNKAQIQALKGARFKTIEDIANATDSSLGRIPLPNPRDLKQRAVDFLEARNTGKAAAEVSELRAQLEEAVAMIAELKADKPKRGRPPKDKAETDETEAEEAA